MDDTPYINDGADTSLRKAVSLLNKIEAKTGSATFTGPVTIDSSSLASEASLNSLKTIAQNLQADVASGVNVSSPVPVTDNNQSLTIDGEVEVSNFPQIQQISGSVGVDSNSFVTALNAFTSNYAEALPVKLTSIQPGPSFGNLPVSGTVTANEQFQPITGSIIMNSGFSNTINCLGYTWMYLTAEGLNNGTWDRWVQWSNDNLNWSGGASFKGSPVFFWNGASWAQNNSLSVATNTVSLSQSGATLFVVPVLGKFFRVASGNQGEQDSVIYRYILNNSSFNPSVTINHLPAITGSVTASGPLTDEQLRQEPVSVKVDQGQSLPVSGPITEAQLRQTPVSVSGPLTNAQLRNSPVEVSFNSQTQANGLASYPKTGIFHTQTGYVYYDPVISAVKVFSYNPNRIFLAIYNPGNAGPFWVKFGGTAESPNGLNYSYDFDFKINSGAALVFDTGVVPADSIYLFTFPNPEAYALYTAYQYPPN